MSFPTIPFIDKNRKLRTINDKIIIFWARRLVKKHSILEPTLLFYNPRFSCIAGKLQENLICYEVIDDQTEFTSSPSWLNEEIQFLIAKSDVITTSSENLYKKILKQRKNVFLIGNGVDVEHFKKSLNDIDLPNDLKKIKAPILGYIGAIGEWFDFELVEEILRKYPNYSIILIGWVFRNSQKQIQNLERKYHNFHFLGRKNYEKLPNYIRFFDICMIPFRIYSLTKSVNPTKLYEYLATGKPIISTNLPEIEKFQDIVYVTKTKQEFVSSIKKIITNEHNPQKSFSLAEEHDWKEKASKMVDLLKSNAINKFKRVQ